MKTSDVRRYYSALQEQFRLQSSILTGVLPHSGERGRNNEERFREFLSRVLPKRFSVGSGFVRYLLRSFRAGEQPGRRSFV